MACLRFAISCRRHFALFDSAVCPLSKSEWRQLTSGRLIEDDWPKDASIAFSVEHLTAYGSPRIWGQDRTNNARVDLERFNHIFISISALDCGCSPLTIDWETDQHLRHIIPTALAENQFFEQLALLDPSLCPLVHEDAVPSTRFSTHQHADKYPLPPYTDHKLHDCQFTAQMELLRNIVWFGDQDCHPRGWELEDFYQRREWVSLLVCYIGRIWQADGQAREWTLFSLQAQNMDPYVVLGLGSREEMDKYEGAALLYFMRAIERDHNMIPVPLFQTTPESRGRWICDLYRMANAP